MEATNTTAITVETIVNAPMEKVWKCWTEPGHIVHWNSASDDWHTPHAENDLKVGGKFSSRMEAKDGSVGFDFSGNYTNVVDHQTIQYTMSDGRKVKIDFSSEGSASKVVETFDAETTHPLDMQKKGWQSILDNFKKYTETN